VTDTLLIAKYADSIIYVARANFLEKQCFIFPTTCIRAKITKHVSASMIRIQRMAMAMVMATRPESYGRNGGAKTGIQKTIM
jgi:hypothetical protein